MQQWWKMPLYSIHIHYFAEVLPRLFCCSIFKVAVTLVFTAVLQIFTRGGHEVRARSKDEVLPQLDGPILSDGTVRVFRHPPGWDASPSKAYPIIKFASTHLYTWVERGTVRVKSLAQEHNTMSPARPGTWTAQSADGCTNHETTATSQQVLEKIPRTEHQKWTSTRIPYQQWRLSNQSYDIGYVSGRTWMGWAMPKGVDPQVSRMVLWVGIVTNDLSSQMFTIWPRGSCAVRDLKYLRRCIARCIWCSCLFKSGPVSSRLVAAKDGYNKGVRDLSLL